MSRQPAADKKESLQALLSMANVVDFVDNSVASGAGLQAGVTSGPPSYLQAHGIKYVPALTAGELGDRLDRGVEGEDGMVSMAQCQRVVTQADLNERANQQVANYMRNGIGAKESVSASRDPVLDRLRSLQAEMERTCRASEHNISGRDDVTARIRELRARVQSRDSYSAPCDQDW